MRPPWSLRARLLAVSLAVLLLFIALTGVALDRAFRDSADAAQQERLEALLYLLMGSLEVAADGRLTMPAQLPETRLSIPGSGLFAEIVRIHPAHDGDLAPQAPAANQAPARWRSESALGLDIPFGAELAPGEYRSDVHLLANGDVYRVVARGVRWAIGEAPAWVNFSVAAPLASAGADVETYRRSLWTALAAMATLLLVALVLVQRWGLRPLHALARRLEAMQVGQANDLGGVYPRELAPLANNLDRLLQRERALLERHRKALADLAHSLKTPLAVLRGAAADASLAALVQEQTRRMDEIVQYQLQRAATAGASRSTAAIALTPLVDRLLASMVKIHGERALTLNCDVAPDVHARIDEGDAMELLGNLVDNACKWARTRVHVSAVRSAGGLAITVEDDGVGIADPARVIERGQRGDEQVPGHGIGLAIVQDIVQAYRGELRIVRSAMGGARVEVWLGEC